MNKNHVTTKLFDHQVKCSKLLVISQVLFWVVMDHDEVEVDKNAKKNEANVQAYCPKKLGQLRLHYTRFIVLTGQIDRPIFARVTNQNKGFTSSCTLAEPAI